MTPVNQWLGHPTGNCLQACIASVLDLPVGDVPDFCGPTDDPEGYDIGWFTNMSEWCAENGYGLVYVNAERELPIVNNAFVIACGESPRGNDKLHAVVCEAVWDGETAAYHYSHDPHPDRSYLVGNPKFFLILFKSST